MASEVRRLYYKLWRIYRNIRYKIRQRLGLPRDVEFKYVDIVFENCDAVRIPSRLVDGLDILDIRKDIFTNYSQQFVTIDYCKEFSITLRNEALKIQLRHDDDIDGFENHIKVFKDITHIAIKPNKGKELYIGVPYKTKSRLSDRNLLQKNKFETDTFTVSSKDNKRSL